MAVILLWLGQWSMAHAEPGDKKNNPPPERSVLVVVSASGRLVAPIKKASEQAAKEQGWRVVVAPAVTAALSRCTIETEQRCVKKPMRQVRGAAGMVLMIYAEESTGDDGEPRVILKGALFNPSTLKVLQTTQRYCSRCHGTARLAELAGELGAELVRAQALQLAPYTKVTVTTTPDKATLFLDGKSVGMTGMSYSAAPGTLRIRVEKVGYKPATQTVELRPNQQLALSIELVPIKTVVRTKRPYVVWGLGLAGLVSAAMGVQWLVVHRDANDGTNQFPTAHRVRTRGYVALGLSAALLGTSAVLWWMSRKSALMVAPTADGVTVLWRGSFE